MIVGDAQVTEKLSLASKGPAKLVLGTAQLGQVYGAANRVGLPSEANAIALVRAALAGGVRTIDTARAYGESERRIGLALEGAASVEIVTKLDPLRSLPVDAKPETAAAAARQSLAASRRALGRYRLDTVLLHVPSHRRDWGGGVWRVLLQERDDGKIGTLGVSVQNPSEAIASLQDRDILHLQLPLSPADRRWSAPEFIKARRSRDDVTIHVRSVLLQGLLAGTPDAHWPVFGGWSPARLVGELGSLARNLGRTDVVDLCLAWVRAQDWIDGVVVGMETQEQLRSNLAHFEQPPLSTDECARLAAPLADIPEALVDPPRWPKERRPLSAW